MTLSAQRPVDLAEVALGELQQKGLEPVPNNFKLWYEHVSGKNPSLSRAIEKMTDTDGKLSEDDANTLYKEYVSERRRADLVENTIEEFEAQIQILQATMQETGKNSSQNCEKLTGITDEFDSSSDDSPTVKKVLESVLSVANSMHAQHKKLEEQLEQSQSTIETLQDNIEQVKNEAMKDALTGVANRAHFEKEMVRHFKNASDDNTNLALIMADIDHFKSFNDTHGHQTGDQVLRLVSTVMNHNVKGKDILARYGGEEFAVILPDTSLEIAKMLADRIREAVADRRLKKRQTNEDLGSITLSLGVAQYSSGDSIESLIERADSCLYAAKNAGRNCVITEADSAAQDKSAIA